MPTVSYQNPWHKAKLDMYGPAVYTTNAKPTHHAGHDIYERIEGSVWDVVKDGVCRAQFAGINSAKVAAEALQEKDLEGVTLTPEETSALVIMATSAAAKKRSASLSL